MEISKITGKGQITLPKTVREDLKLENGSNVIFLKHGMGYILVNEKDVESGEYFIDSNK